MRLVTARRERLQSVPPRVDKEIMPAPKTPPQEKGRRNRSVGSFLLFLFVLVVILVMVGKENLAGRKDLTQDEYLWQLYSGQVDEQAFRGENLIDGKLENGESFQVKFADLASHERELQQIKAVRSYQPVTERSLLTGMAKGLFSPRLARILTATEEKVLEGTEPGEGASEVKRDMQLEKVLVHAYAKARADVATTEDFALADLLPEHSGLVWLEVRDVDDLGSFVTQVQGAGATVENLTFDRTARKGSSWHDTDSFFATFLFMWAPWLLFFALILFWMRQMRGQGGPGGVMSFGRSRAQLYTKENHTNVTFDDMAGAEEAKEEVREIVEFLKNPGRFTRIGGRIPRGVLLVGSPGCGKTLLAKAIAGEAEVPFYSISGSDFVEMFVGVGASRVRDLFKQARENTPCIIFLDEIDAVGRRRGSGMGGGHDEREQTLNAILVEMDGFGTDEGIILLAATNRPDVLDPALLRPGRFDREVTIDLPDVKGREAILEVHLKKIKVAEGIDTGTLARSTPGYSGADLAATVNEAAIMAALARSEEVSMEHLEEARDKVRYGRQKKTRALEEEDRKITAYHEAGHAVVASVLEETDGPHKVTIIPRGRALGATMVLPEKESYHMQRKRLYGQLAVLFGGRASEEHFCGDISAGASDDIHRATEMARAMVTELGMSEKIGPINYAERQGSDFLGTELLSGRWHSDETSREIDEEIKRVLDESFEKARAIVRDHQAEIECLTVNLLEYETISGAEIEGILAGVPMEELRPPEPVSEPAEAAVAEVEEAEEESASADDSKTLPGDLSGEAGLSPA
jgi:cell division protease FtsH